MWFIVGFVNLGSLLCGKIEESAVDSLVLEVEDAARLH